jgi:hypothetical protein
MFFCVDTVVAVGEAEEGLLGAATITGFGMGVGFGVGVGREAEEGCCCWWTACELKLGASGIRLYISSSRRRKHIRGGVVTPAVYHLLTTTHTH